MAVASFSLLRGEERQEDTSSEISWGLRGFVSGYLRGFRSDQVIQMRFKEVSSVN